MATKKWRTELLACVSALNGPRRLSGVGRMVSGRPRPTYVVHLRPEPRTDGIRMLRAGLKTLLRRYRLRCVAISTKAEARKRLTVGKPRRPEAGNRR